MSGWLYEQVAEDLAPYDITPGGYVRELVADGLGWAEIGRCLEADIDHWRPGRIHFPSDSALKRWAGTCA